MVKSWMVAVGANLAQMGTNPRHRLVTPPSEMVLARQSMKPLYNLASVGKALPAWVSAKKKLVQKAKRRKWNDPNSEVRLEVLQDLFFPTSSGRVKVSRDGGTLMATGGYPPQVRAYELRELSLKFSLLSV